MLLVDWQGEIVQGKSRNGRDYTLYVVYVKTDGEPYPVRITIFENPAIPAGRYRVPAKIGLSFDRRNLLVNLDFANAEPIK